MNEITLKASKQVRGLIKLPGSKSITNRVLLMAALGSGVTKLIDPLRSEDTDQMINALIKLGVSVKKVNDDKNIIEIKGAEHNFPNKNTNLFLGNSGTTFRPLSAVLAMMRGDYYLSGIERMHERPIKDLVDALEQMGSSIQYEKNHGYPPIIINNSSIEISEPIKIGKHYAVLKLEKWKKLELNIEMRKKLEAEMMTNWISKQTDNIISKKT